MSHEKTFSLRNFRIWLLNNTIIYYPYYLGAYSSRNLKVLSRTFRELVVDRTCAITIKTHALDAVKELSQILATAQEKCDETEYEDIKRVVGISIGEIQIHILNRLYEQFKDLDDLM